MSTAAVTEIDLRTPAEVNPFGPWHCSAHRPGSITHPDQLVIAPSEWLQAPVPGTVASALNANGRWNFDLPADIDSQDWWYRTTFSAAEVGPGNTCRLCFDGLATLAEVWLNGELILSTQNMFRAYSIEIADRLRPENELFILFRSLTEDLKQKRPRPRWKTKVVSNQQLRWRRTSLQGRIPGWSPPAPAIGPWREIRLETSSAIATDVRVASRLEGSIGIVTVSARLPDDSDVQRAILRVGSHEAALEVDTDSGSKSLRGELRIHNPPRWWPHTHGRPDLLNCELKLDSTSSAHTIPCPDVGFRTLEVDAKEGFGIRINGEPIYCRGACWTVSDILSLAGSENSLRHDLQLARDAGVNMLRVGGTMVYESDLFYRLCDEFGILVWQDFMFANMDYPVADEAFRAEVRAEATYQLDRLSSHPCVTVYCGNSEVAQQAAMLGMPRELWHHDWFAEELPNLCAALHPGTTYVPSTPTGGVLPFHANTGITHFYGVGAYLRSMSELRRTNVRFTPECLGFSNIPDDGTIEEVADGTSLVAHDPRWKRRVPRDSGAGWDFEDVRDHYLKELYNVDPVALRSRDHARYLQLSRLASGEMMAQAFSEWRGVHSENRGGLVWFYKDLWPGAGWGIIDSKGRPKAAYYALKRTWQSRQLTITDEGLNGLHLHLVNETNEAASGFLEVVLLKEPKTVVAKQDIPFDVSARSTLMKSADEVLGGFYDVSYAYRFGPAHHDVVIATWYDSDRKVISEGMHFVQHRDPPRLSNVALETSVDQIDATTVRVTLHSDQFLHGVQLQADGFLPDDNSFHLPPNRTKELTFRACGTTGKAFKAELDALNQESSVSITLPRKPRD